MNITEFTIDRKTWYRGQGGERSRLLRQDGQKCCLGFFGEACGLSKPRIRGQMYLMSPLMKGSKKGPLPIIDAPELQWLFLLIAENKLSTNNEAGELARINDSVATSEKNREDYIVKTFANHGITVHFIN